MVQLEAMAAGVPVVNFNLDTAVPYVSKDGEVGITFTVNDAKNIAALLRDDRDDVFRLSNYRGKGINRINKHFAEEE